MGELQARQPTAAAGSQSFGLAAAIAGVAVVLGAFLRFLWQRSRIEGSRLGTGYRANLLLAAAAATGGTLVILALVRNP